MINKQSYQIQGMRQDNLVGTGYSSKFAHEIMNLRFNTIGDYTTASWTTEKGTKYVNVKLMNIPNSSGESYLWITGIYYGDNLHFEIEDFQPIGQAVINDEWVLFGKLEHDIDHKLDCIINLRYKYINNEEKLYGRVLFYGNLNFDKQHPIETITYYENENIQKVYWTDGINQPRVINIKDVEDERKGFNGKYSGSNLSTLFDFTREVALKETVDITKHQDGTGLFPPCTVKYAISYYNKNGQESNIVYDSPLYYPIFGDRACSPDELSGDSFEIRVSNLDLKHGFDYIRLYSIVKTTNNATPIVRIVADKSLKNLNNESVVTFYDTNTTGEIIDPSIIQFIGGKEIIAHTFDQKSNTLFLGNIELKTKSVTDVLGKTNINKLRESSITFENDKVLYTREQENDGSVYQWLNQLNDSTIIYNSSTIHIDTNSQYVKHFKHGETYRFGIQFQDNKGCWSEVIFLKDLENEVIPYTKQEDVMCKFARLRYVLDDGIKTILIDNGYKKARLVCCYPTNTDRSVIAQGVIAPTVYNNYWRDIDAPYVMSSWFFRPNDEVNKRDGNYLHFNRTVLPWKDDQPLDEAFYDINLNEIKEQEYDDGRGIRFKTVPEIQSTLHTNYYKIDKYFNPDTHTITITGANSKDDSIKDAKWLGDKSVYRVSRKVMTFHSPEIEFDETLRTLPRNNWTVHIIGRVPINSYAAKYYLEAENPIVVYGGNKGSGFKNGYEDKGVEIYSDPEQNDINNNNIGPDVYGSGSHVTSLGEWNDVNLYTEASGMNEFPDYCIYPFHRKNSLNDYVKDINDWDCNDGGSRADFPIKQSSLLHSKVLSHILYSTTSEFETEANTHLISEETGEFNIFDSSEVVPLQIKTENVNHIYYGNVNSISPVSNETTTYQLRGYSSYNDKILTGSYPLAVYHERNSGRIYYNLSGVFKEPSNGNNSDDKQGVYVSDPVPITYKSTPHGVFSTIYTRGDLKEYNAKYPFMYLAEIRREINPGIKFGGSPIDNNINNIYVPCGPTVDLLPENTNINLYGLEGDTYYMRYDNLKTYPYATDDTNQIVEILSFMVETRVNIDGRYDKNRGLLDNTTITNTNFNLINKSYTQDNNTFTFLTLDELSSELDYFANQITWTNTKVSGEDIDTWTHITLASTADADGSLGSINKIINLNDKLLLFQDHGLAQISFNETTAISTESGVPLELAKTGKYNGLNYISREVGCQNKWSISKSKNGLFWIDDSRQELLALGESIQPISTSNGFDAFFIKQLPQTFESWKPNNTNNFVTYYDKLSNDVYYINKNYCLAWNEQTGTFTSFYNYEAVPYMVNIGKHSLMWKNGIWAARESNTYSTFFGQNKDYWMTLVCDGMTDKSNAFPADKVFNNIEYRADIYNLSGANTNYSISVFNTKHVWNGYQDSQEVALDGARKFNTWRVQLPRHHDTRDRIRNPFCYIKLKQDNTSSGRPSTQTDRMILHDLAVYFDMQ